MSDYSLQVTWSTKDALATGSQLKAISATELGNEFSAIATAIATKYDSDDLASEAVAEALTSNSKLITPLNLDQVFKDNDGVISDLQALTGQAADALYGWDNSAAAAIGFTLGTGLAFDTTTVKLSHLGIESLADPNADRILFWDDSAGATAWLTLSSDFSISGTTISLASTISTQTITTLTSTSIVLAGATLAANSDVLEWGNQAILMHNSTSYEGSEVWFSTSAPTTQGNNGDIWYQYTA